MLNNTILQDFTMIKPTTQKAERIRKSAEYYRAKDCQSLYNLYNSFSERKYDAFTYCVNLARKYNGRYFMGGGNSSTFTFYFDFESEGVEYTAYITKDNNFLVER